MALNLLGHEVLALKSSKSKSELASKAKSIRDSIIHSFSEKNPNRVTLLNELDDLIAMLSADLPDLSSFELQVIENEVSTSPSPPHLQQLISKYQRIYPGSPQVLVAINSALRHRQEFALKRDQEEKHREYLIMKEEAEKAEFRLLVEEISALGFTESKHVSAYIVKHKLGSKYKNISGILQMELQENVWDFNGGFPPHIYARLCDALGLKNNTSQAVVKKFTPYNDIVSN